MLSIGKPILKQKIQKILYDAYMTQFSGNVVPEAAKYDNIMEEGFKKNADKFSKIAAGPATDAIYNFIKEIGINITVSGTITAPPLPPVLPSGPCTGSISASNIIVL